MEPTATINSSPSPRKGQYCWVGRSDVVEAVQIARREKLAAEAEDEAKSIRTWDLKSKRSIYSSGPGTLVHGEIV